MPKAPKKLTAQDQEIIVAYCDPKSKTFGSKVASYERITGKRGNQAYEFFKRDVIAKACADASNSEVSRLWIYVELKKQYNKADKADKIRDAVSVLNSLLKEAKENEAGEEVFSSDATRAAESYIANNPALKAQMIEFNENFMSEVKAVSE